MTAGVPTRVGTRADGAAEPVCPHFHEAVELIGRRWAGAILFTLLDGPLRFAELAATVPGLSDRLLSRRLKELEREALVERSVAPGTPVRVSYELTDKGRELEELLLEIGEWARRWNDAGVGVRV